MGFLLFCMLILSLIGCSPQSVADQPGQGITGVGALAMLPPLAEIRSSSMVLGFAHLGRETALRELNAWNEGDSLRLASSTHSITWGIWGFANSTGASSCTVEFSGNAGSEAYLAISDYSRGAWEFRGLLPGPQQVLDVDDPRYVSPSGHFYVAVIAYGGSNILVDRLELSANVSPAQLTIDNSGGYTSLAMVNGRPAISFYDDADHDLRYVRAADAYGTSWDAAQTLDSTGDTGQYTSLKVVDGFPAIAYYDFTEKNLRYVRALDANGETWGSPVTVDGAGTTGEYCSLDVVSGSPAISYYYYDGPALRYVRAADSTGSTWSAPLTVDSDGNTGQYTSLAEVYSTLASYPAISYRNGGAGELRYVRGTDATGSAWAAPVILESGDNTGFSSSLAIVNTYPAVCYYNSTQSELRYKMATDMVGDTWRAAQTLDGLTEDAGDYCSLAVVGGVPAISYYNGLHGDLRYIKAQDANGDNWGSSVLLDETSNVIGQYTFLIDIFGVPAISYYDQTNGKLRYKWGQ